MQKRPLGRSGLDIAPLVFGGNVFGWTADRETSFRLLDAFVDALRAIHAEALADPERVRAAPHELPVKRLDELAAARNPNVAW